MQNPQKPNKNLPLIIALSCCGGCVVLGIPIFAAILFPVFAQAREQARAQVCLSNVKQSSLAVLMYEQDYDEQLPRAAEWTGVIGTFTQNPQVFVCPTAAKGDGAGTGVQGYAYFSSIATKNAGWAVAPARTPLIYDSSTLQKNASDAFKSLPLPGRHSKRNMVAFLDGHAAAQSVDQTDATTQFIHSGPLFVKPKK